MMIVTIDGPSGTGKTTVAKEVAKRLSFVYFDTGAMYRALTWTLLQKKISLQDSKALEQCLLSFDFQITEKQGVKHYFVDQIDLTDKIRSREVTQAVSAVAALKVVRASLLKLQRRFAEGQSVVFEGRDLGTVVFPEAKVKIFLTADPRVRAERRLQELLKKDPAAMQGLTHEQVLNDLIRRDTLDSTREVAPLLCPPDAFVVDTTPLSIEQVVDQIISHCGELR